MIDYQLFLFTFQSQGILLLWYHYKRPVYDNAVSRRSWLCWCDNWRQDWTEIHLYGLQCGLFRIALHLTGRAAMHLVVPNLTEPDCVVRDSTAVSCSGQDGTGQSCYGLHCSAVHLTGLDLTYMGPGLCWIEMYLAGRKWIGIGLDGTGLDWTGLDLRRFHWMDWTARQWSGLDWTEPDHFRRLNWTALYFTGLDCRSLSLTSPDCTTLLYLALPWIELESTIQDSHCTSLHWSTPNCIPRFQRKLIKTVLHCIRMYSTGLDHIG